MYFTVPYTKESFAMANMKDGDETQTLIEDNDEEKSKKPIEKISFMTTLKKMFVNLFSVSFIFFVTLSQYPGLYTGTEFDTEDIPQDQIIIINNLIFMIGDLLSRFAVYIPIKWNKWVIFALSISRVLFYIPILIYYLGVYTNPYVMFVIMLFFSFSNGYISAWGINLAYNDISQSEMKVGGNLVMVSMNVGLICGATLLFIFGTVLPTPESSSSM